jgi:hypothetical protein
MVVARLFSLAYYYLAYAVRSSPAVMMPQFTEAFGVSSLGVSNILGMYYYSGSVARLLAGILLDRFGAEYVVSTWMGIPGDRASLIRGSTAGTGYLGQLVQGAGSAFQLAVIFHVLDFEGRR